MFGGAMIFMNLDGSTFDALNEIHTEWALVFGNLVPAFDTYDEKEGTTLMFNIQEPLEEFKNDKHSTDFILLNLQYFENYFHGPKSHNLIMHWCTTFFNEMPREWNMP